MPRQPTPADIVDARRRLAGTALHTPLERAPLLATESGAAEVRLKREDVQPTGAFKTRGAHNRVGMLAEGRPEVALVTASTGNHGIAMATAARRYDMRLTVLVGADISPAKLERLRALESDRCIVELFGRDPNDAEAEGRRRDDAGRAVYVSPYNDPDVIAGQGTVGLEILDDWPDVEAIVVPVGGGGLISGIGTWVKAVKPGVRVIGVQPVASPPIYAYLETGSTKPMPIAPTLADGVAGNLERDSVTWQITKRVVDSVVVVEEREIADAMRWAIDEQHVLLEGSAALGIAALRGGRLPELMDRRVAVVLSGRNVTGDDLRRVLLGATAD